MPTAPKPHLYLGLMCGTSADAIDVALVDWPSNNNPRLVETREHPLPPALRQRLLALNNEPALALRELSQLDTEIAEVHAEAVIALLGRAGKSPADIAAVGFHGQTVYHDPEPPTRNTTQLGNAHLLAALIRTRVVGDLRRADIAAGGQGAPLAPALHRELFSEKGKDIAVVNLGGIANLSLLPGDADRPVLGFDTGPANCLLDEWAQHCLGERCDRDAQFARDGSADTALLQRLLAHGYFDREVPKSTGRDLFNLNWIKNQLHGEGPADVQATLTLLTARSVADHLRRLQPKTRALYVCGGGVHNPLLMQQLTSELPGVQVASTAAKGIDPDWIEAMLVAWLARQHCTGRTGNLPSVTGADQAVCLGVSYYPPGACADRQPR